MSHAASTPLARPRREHAFTLIEMIVALFLLALVMAVAMPSVANMLDMGNRGAANAQASADSSYALQLVEADLRRAQAMRGAGEFVGPSGTNPTVITALSSTNVSSHDIISAGPTRLELWSDALGTNTTPERITYELVVQNARNSRGPCDRQAKTSWCVVRTMQPIGGPAVVEVIAHGAGTFPADSACVPNTTPATAIPRLFCYQHQVPAGAGPLANRYRWATWNRTCATSWAAPPAPTPNWNATNVGAGPAIRTWHDRTGTLPNSSIWPLDTISAIGIVLPAGGRTDGARGLSTSITTVELRNRGSAEYLTAILCGRR